MSKKMKITITIEDEQGEAIVTSESERRVPYIQEMEEQGFRAAFHDLETAVLESRKEAGDKAVSEYLELISQKKTISEYINGDTVETSEYGIESELGQIITKAHRITNNSQNKTYYDSGEELFEKTASREKFKSSRFMELAFELSTSVSVRKASHLLNRLRLEKEGISPTTLRNTIEREGAAMQRQIAQKCETVLLGNGFDSSGALRDAERFAPSEVRHIEQAAIENASIELNMWEYNAADYELPSETVNVSIDDVGVKRQTETRPKDETKQHPKRVDNTVIHVQSGKKSYILNAASVASGLRALIGFLLFNGLIRKQIVVFADGAKEINNAVTKMFHFANCKVILDWYHLEKKCKEQLSLALRGSKIRNEFLDELRPCLWYGNVRGAIKLLMAIDPKKVKDFDVINKLIEYLERVQSTIPCYALRKQLGLRNSSNLGEKANDMIVSNRQKHNGMSWSNDGSVAFATVAAASRNNEVNRWIHRRDIGFSLLDDVA